MPTKKKGGPQLNRDLSALLDVEVPGAIDDLAFDPTQGVAVIEAPGSGQGSWVGAPSGVWTGDAYYLSYRTRLPQPERGCRTQIARSDDGVRFEPVWTAYKGDFGTTSIERSALVMIGPDEWRLYISYVDGADGRWRIDVIEASSPEEFEPQTREPVLTAAHIDSEGVKDPWVGQLDSEWVMTVSYAPSPEGDVDRAKMHATHDVYNTGLTKSATGLATSADGLHWRWEGDILQPRSGDWDSYAARLNSIIGAQGRWVGFYDGSASVAENYEERCGMVVSNDLRHWDRVSDRPSIGAVEGPGSVRYLEAVQAADWARFYYEFTKEDGAHELRTYLLDGSVD